LRYSSLSASISLFAQSTTGAGTIQGTVRDISGAVLPGAKVTITNTETGDITKLTGNNEGYFTTPPIRIGKYKIRAEHSGMKAWESQTTSETGQLLEIDPRLSPDRSPTPSKSSKPSPSSPQLTPPKPARSIPSASATLHQRP
jgi:hypothetical protein